MSKGIYRLLFCLSFCLSLFLVTASCNTGPAQISGGSDAVVADIEDGAVDIDINKVLSMGFKFNVKASSVNSKKPFYCPDWNIAFRTRTR